MMRKTRKTFTVIKWVAAVMFLLFVAADAMSWYLSVKLRPVIMKELKDLVLNSTDSLYRIEFSTVNTNFLLGNASVSNVKIIPDTLIFNKLIKLKRAPNNIYEVSLKKLTIRNFHPFSIYKDKELSVEQLLFEHPKVVMINRQFDFNENRPPRPNKSPYEYISKLLKLVSVNTISLKDVSFKYINKNVPVPEVDSLDKLDITLKDWLIDANSATDPTRIYLLKDVLINLNDYQFATPDSLYHIQLNEFSFAASTGKLNVKKFAVVPRYSEMDFGRKVGFSKERFSIQLSDISLSGIDLPLYIKKQELAAQEMNITNGFVSVFNNNELPSQGVARVGKFPHQLLQMVKAQLTVKKLNLSDVDISYAEFDSDSKQKGRITFEKTSGTILNVTNEEKVKAKNPFMLANLKTYMMGQGKLMVNFKFDLNAKNGAFSYQGELGDMDGGFLNRITKPLGMLQVNSGMVKKLSFNVVADEAKASGDLNFRYKDLSIGLMKKVEGKNRLVKLGLFSMLANSLVIRPDNPDDKGKMVGASIYFQRDPRISFFSFIWKTLLQGIKYTVGLTPEKQAEIDAQIAKFEKMKNDREQRREARRRRKK
ncbi:hypothetical protein HDE69_001191 [Pedobacter cryoconitis]|uniref:DUF748 domain-containing protein n=1 Tax=Pedobacter cryoconitis TaxID=188932 RepID=A0A7W9DII0_9SPHI|nr:hypothetical protein [Pedobacter cryoconitis]MBB5620153.1 hypothetical protein [Pedobacter cryoconitis]